MKTMKTKWTKAGSMFLAAAAVLVVLFQRRGYSGGRDSCGRKRCCQDEFLVRYSFAGVPCYQRRCSRQQQFLGYRKFEVNAFFKFERRLCRS